VCHRHIFGSRSTLKGCLTAGRSLARLGGYRLGESGISGKGLNYMKQQLTGKASKDGYINAIEGIKRKTLVYGNNTLMTEFKLEKGKKLPMHKHPHEQTGYLISGHIILHINEQKFEMFTGDSWCIPGDTEHGADVMEDSIAIEVFCPIRVDYL